MKSFITTHAAALSIALLATIPAVQADNPTAPTDAASTATPAPAPSDDTVVSKITIDGQTFQITYGQVKDKLKVLPPQLQDAPFNEFFPILLKSIETEQIIMYLAKKAKVTDDPEYQKLVQECQKGVMQKLFLDKAVESRATDADYKAFYDEKKNSAPKEDEYDISIITLTDKGEAAKVLKDAKSAGPAGFGDLADKKSIYKFPGGNMGYVRLGDLPDEFRDKVKGAAKATVIPNVIEVTMPNPNDPNKTVTAYSVLLVKDKREAKFPDYEAVKSKLKAPVHSKLMKDVLKEFEKQATIEHPLEKADAAKAVAPKAKL